MTCGGLEAIDGLMICISEEAHHPAQELLARIVTKRRQFRIVQMNSDALRHDISPTAP
jgi:hypothetical protein